MVANGFFKKALGAFVEFEDGSQSQTQTQTQAPQPVVTVPIQTQSQSQAPSVNQEMVDSLMKIVANRKTAYTALVEASERMKSVIPDEGTRLKAAYTMVSAENQRTLDSIIQAIDVHLTDLDGELRRFSASLDDQMQKKVGGPRLRIQAIAENKTANLAEIDRLRKQIDEIVRQNEVNDSEAQRIAQETATIESEINSVGEKFKLSLQYVRQYLIDKKTQFSSTLV